MHSDPASYELGSGMRAAAIANLFLGAANNGGLNSFLTSNYDLDVEEVLDALTALGAAKAARQLDAILSGLGSRLPASTQDERWSILEERWQEDLDEYDVLSKDADAELMAVLETHVAANQAFYSRLD
jgi:Domain of unknown function (DUF4375)